MQLWFSQNLNSLWKNQIFHNEQKHIFSTLFNFKLILYSEYLLTLSTVSLHYSWSLHTPFSFILSFSSEARNYKFKHICTQSLDFASFMKMNKTWCCYYMKVYPQALLIIVRLFIYVSLFVYCRCYQICTWFYMHTFSKSGFCDCFKKQSDIFNNS